MDIRKLQRAIVDGLEDVKAHQIAVFNTEHLSPLFERVIIATGNSNRQTRALAASVRDAVRKSRLPVLSVEGEDNGEWIIVDCGAAVAHIMQPAIRDYYRLEEIWGGKPVRMKLAAETAVRLPKAAADEPRPVAGKTAAKSASTPARATSAGRTARKSSSPRQPAPGRPATSVSAGGAKTGKPASRGRTTVESGQVRAKAPSARPTGHRAASRPTRPAAKKTGPRKTARR